MFLTHLKIAFRQLKKHSVITGINIPGLGLGLTAGLFALSGLFGLTLFVVQRRRKEIGIRKVLGATAAQIAGLLSAGFLKPVLSALLVAAPLSWYLLQEWLDILDVNWFENPLKPIKSVYADLKMV